STACRWSSVRRSCPATGASPRCPTGSGPSGPGTTCPRRTGRETRTIPCAPPERDTCTRHEGSIQMTDLKELHRRNLERFGQYVHAVRNDQWQGSTPCAEWDVRALVHHLVSESMWMPPLL